MTGAALLLTYSGAAVADGFTGKTTYPRIESTPTPTPSPTPSTSSAGPDETCEGSLCLSVPQEQQLCAAAGCHASIVIANTGSRPLRINEIEIEGPAAQTFRHSGDCANQTVKAGRTCTVVVTVVAEPTGTATLVIHQNLAGPATQVTLVPSGTADRRPNFRMSTKATCSISTIGSDRFTIRTAVRNDGPGGFEGSVPVRVAETGGQTREFAATIDAVVLSIPTDLSSADGTHTFTLTVDPDHEVDEADETNNIRRITATVPQGPSGTSDVPCTPS
ncbi:CARDB domain-containing protein [Paractinoplanes rishiriensis]|uniref:CARDB domain-containing protein n=1 Tax=Paractinoplanes rishiriensis TaxID=1050105 RepID=UPI001944E228|nr:CARDB domain-containing protein [Actinoplanes rishiriensis]